MCTVLALCCSRRTCPNVARRPGAVRKPRNTHDCCGHVTQSEQWLLQDPTSLVHVTYCPLPYHLLCACLWEPCPLAHNMDRRRIVSQWRKDPLPFRCLKDGLSRKACSHHLSFLRLDIPNTTCWGSLSSGFKARTLSGAFQLTSSDGDNLVLPTMAQLQLICGTFLTWRLKSSNFLVGTLLGVKFQGQCWEWKFCRLGCVTAPSSWGWQLCGWETGWSSNAERLYCGKIPQLLEGIVLKEKGFLVCHQHPADCPESGISQQSLWHLPFVK